jgi:hypothetical protein
MNWQTALDNNYGDYAYASDGGMIKREGDGNYSVTNGNIKAASAGRWHEVERKGLLREGIPGALKELGMSDVDWFDE